MSKSRQICCIEGCSNTPANAAKMTPPIKFYAFPRDSVHAPWKQKKRRQWINAIRKYTRYNQSWEPSASTRICSTHFVDNVKAEHPLHPSYVPTIFPSVKQRTKQSSARFYRQQRRQATMNQLVKSDIQKMDNSVCVKLHNKDLESEVMTVSRKLVNDVGCQACIEVESNNSSDLSYFFCLLEKDNGINSVQVQVNIVKKETADKISYADIPFKKYVKNVGCDAIGNDKNEFRCPGFHGISSIKSDTELSSLTGVSFAAFNYLLELLPNNKEIKLSNRNKLLLTLMKLKTGVSFSALGVFFDVHRTTAQRTFIIIVECLSVLLNNFIFWPSKETVKATLPKAFKKYYFNARVIIDCTEIKTQIPSKVKDQVLMYSQYKSNHTAKFLIGSTPNGLISFVSKCYGGRATDSFITNDSGLIDLLEPGDVVLADKGFPSIRTDVKRKNAVFVMPPFLHDSQFSAEEVEETYNIASVRIHIERVIQRIKDFSIFSKMPVTLLPHVDQIVFIICALINLKPPIIQED